MTPVFLLNLMWQLSLLAVVTLGLAIIFGQLRIMNMAHGEFVMIGAYAPIITSTLGLPNWMQLPVCIACVALVALILERAIIRHLYGRLFDSLLATWGISILLREMVELAFGRGFQSVPLPISGTVSWIGIDYPAYRSVIIGVIILLFIGLTIWYKRSLVATRIKAMVNNPELAQAVGINTVSLSRRCFVFGCISAGLAGLIIAPTAQISPLMGLDYLIRSFFVVVVGGLGSLEGLAIGVGLIAGSQTLLGALFNQTYGYIFVLVLSILFLWLRPNGIYRNS